MNDLNDNNPTHCEHDILLVPCVEQRELAERDKERLDELGFHYDEELSCWASYRFGST